MKEFYTSLHQNFISLVKSPALFVLVILPVFLLFAIGSITPVSWIIPQIISLSIIIISFLSVGIQYSEYRKTNFFKITKNTFVPMISIILGTFVVVFIVTFIITLFLIILTWFFTQAVPILSQTLDNIKIDSLKQYQSLLVNISIFSSFDFSKINWLLLIYSISITIIMTSLLAIMFANFFTSLKTYTLFSMTYIIIYISLCGLLVPINIINQQPILMILINIIPNYHTNSLIDSSINTGLDKNLEQFSIYINDINNWMYTTIDSSGDPIIDNLNNRPIINGSDPININALYAILPWLQVTLIQAMQIISNLFGFNSSSDYFSVVSTALHISYWIDEYSITYNFILNINNSLLSIFDGINVSKYAFGKSLFAIVENIYPYIVVLLTLPSFIKVVVFND